MRESRPLETVELRPRERGSLSPAFFRAWMLLGLLCVTLAGCSLVRLGYGQLDTIAAWRADHYFDLDAKQKDEFRSRFRRLHDWHRREQLPDYARFLDEAAVRVQKGITHEDVHWIVRSVRARYAELAKRGAPDAAALLATVTPAQIESLKRRLTEDNQKFVREHRLDGTPDERDRERARRSLEQIREWVGALTPEQEQRIAELTRALPAHEALRHEDRLRRQREFIALLADRGDTAQFSARLGQWMVDLEYGRSPDLSHRMAESWKKRAEFYAAVDRLLTREQREHFVRRLQARGRDFRKLAQDAAPAGPTRQSAK